MHICFLGTTERLAYLQNHASAGVKLDNMADFVGTTIRPSSIESRAEELELAIWVIDRSIEAEKRGFDAIITGCFGDPGVEAARERVRIPVIAPGETALLTARMISHYFSIISPLPETVPLAREQTHKAGVHPFVASIEAFNMPVKKIRDRDPKTIELLIDLARKCVEQDGAEAIVCACASMSLLAEEIAPEIGVPVLNSVRLSLRAAEMLVGAGLTHSRVTFPKPVKL
jgi:allantoin racemase